MKSTVIGTLFLKLPLIILKAFRTIAISPRLIIYCFCDLFKGSRSRNPIVVRLLRHATEERLCIIARTGVLQLSQCVVNYGGEGKVFVLH